MLKTEFLHLMPECLVNLFLSASEGQCFGSSWRLEHHVQNALTDMKNSIETNLVTQLPCSPLHSTRFASVQNTGTWWRRWHRMTPGPELTLTFMWCWLAVLGTPESGNSNKTWRNAASSSLDRSVSWCPCGGGGGGGGAAAAPAAAGGGGGRLGSCSTLRRICSALFIQFFYSRKLFLQSKKDMILMPCICSLCTAVNRFWHHFILEKIFMCCTRENNLQLKRPCLCCRGKHFIQSVQK